MPSTATIAASDFTTFVTKTTISSAQMNSNFSTFRGHLLPLDPNTSAAADDSYGLGSSDNRWSASHQLAANLYDTAGGSIQILGGSNNVIPRLSSGYGAITTSAAFGQIAVKVHTAVTSGSYTLGAIELTTKGGPIDISLQMAHTAAGSAWIQMYPTTSSGIPSVMQATFKVGGVAVTPTGNWTPMWTQTSSLNAFSVPPSMFRTTLYGLAAGTHTITCETTVFGAKADFSLVAFTAREL